MVEIHIDRLILDGFDPGDRPVIRSAVKDELARLIREHGPPARVSGAGSIDAGTMDITPGAPARQIGIEIARSIYQGLET